MKEKICEILGISTASYYRWKEDRKIIKMLEKYFTEEELNEFIQTEKISRLEKEKIKQERLEQYDDHILYNAAQKIRNMPNLFGNKKEFDLNLFLNILQKEKYRNKIKEEIEKEKKFYNTIIINGTIKKVDMFSNLELELIHNNFDEFGKIIK